MRAFVRWWSGAVLAIAVLLTVLRARPTMMSVASSSTSAPGSSRPPVRNTFVHTHCSSGRKSDEPRQLFTISVNRTLLDRMN